MVIYETINKINGKRYIGKDKHNDPRYLGSGKLLNKAIKKYGRENFIKTILEHCDSEEHMSERERHWIKITNAQTSDLYYNIGEGGNGGDNITNNPKRDEFMKKMILINNQPRTNTKHSADTKEHMKHAAKGRYTLEWFQIKYGLELGKQYYDERNLKLSARDLKGQNNPAWRNISKTELIDVIRTGCTMHQLLKTLNISETCLRNKLKLFWNCRTYSEVKRLIL
jgi:group I intron endonuclease